MPEVLLPEFAAAYGPLAALALYLWVNRQKAVPVEDATKDLRDALKRIETATRRIEVALSRIEAIMGERNHD